MEFSQGQIVSMFVTFVLVVTCVLIHYEILRILTVLLKRISLFFRLRIVILIFGLLTAHLIEVWIFAFGYVYMNKVLDYGFLQGMTSSNIFEYAYYSVVTYTTLGYGDIVPVGPIRFMSAMEALTGYIMVAWSASFTFLEMRIFWRDD